MTVRELRAELFKIKNQELRVILASDEEGNTFGDIGKDFGNHKIAGEEGEVLAIYPEGHIDGSEVEGIWDNE